MECPICIESFNKTNHAKIVCGYCHYEACRDCIKRFLLDSTLQPTCPNCKVGWTAEYIRTVMPKSFLNNEYKKHREDVLLSLEESLLPQTQEYASFQLELEKDWNECMEMKKLISNLKHDYVVKTNTYYRKVNRGFQRSSKDRRQFVMKCPDEECRGFLSTQYKCGQCSKSFCKSCYGWKEDHQEHTCNPEEVETVNLLNTNTKRCPKCSISIFKVDGCFAENVPIMMWDKSIKMSQDIVVGDVLMGDDGTERVVESLVTGEDELFQVKGKDGTQYVVNSQHILVLKYRQDKRITWFNKRKSWVITWFDRDTLKEKNKFFKVNEGSTKENTRTQVEEFRNTLLDVSDEVYIKVEDFLTLDHYSKKSLLGFRKNPANDMREVRTTIEVTSVGRGQYYGWSVDKNKKFLHETCTVLHNCDQMWCTECHTAFSWNTGKIINGIVHNPHYFAWRRTLDDDYNNDDNPCNNNNRVPSIRHFRYLDIHYQNIILKLIQSLTHIREVTIPSLMNEDMDEFTRNRDIRMDYLNNRISKDYFKWIIQKRDKASQKKRMIANLWDMCVMSYTDLLNNLTLHKNFHTFEEEHEELLQYVNSEFHRVCKLYSSRIIQISNRWDII